MARAIRVQNEGTVVSGMINGSQTGGTVVGCANRHGCGMKGADGGPVFRAKRNMDWAADRRIGAQPEFDWSAIAKAAMRCAASLSWRKFLLQRDTKRREDGLVEAPRTGIVRHPKANMIKHQVSFAG